VNSLPYLSRPIQPIETNQHIMNTIDNIIEVYRLEGYTITREEAIEINDAIDFAYETWTKNQ